MIGQSGKEGRRREKKVEEEERSKEGRSKEGALLQGSSKGRVSFLFSCNSTDDPVQQTEEIAQQEENQVKFQSTRHLL